MAVKKNHPDGGEKSDRPINIRPAEGTGQPTPRTFPGPRGATETLRVAIDRGAYAELASHAKSSLAAEVCGVLAGRLCADDDGLFVHVEAVVRGAAATEGSTHVTFTQDTWNAIHRVLEHDFPRLRIVGWYHTHPGFGVEFSEMDVFIQRNFFAGPAQIALVTDPVNGDVAICLNTPSGIDYLKRFWIDGREQQCRLPARAPDPSDRNRPAPDEKAGETVRSLETRVGQLVQSLDEMRTFQYRFMIFCGGVFCLALIAIAGYTVYSQWSSRLEPPKLNQIVPIPVQVGDKVILLGVGISSWEVPPELNALMLEAEMLKREAAEKEAKALAAREGRDTNGTAANAPAKPAKK